MNGSPHYLDELLFAVFPYMAFFTFFLVTIQRYRMQSFSYSSLSSQFLENQQHFWGLVPFHYGILAVLTGHILGFLIPREVLLFNSVPLRLYFLEVSGLIFALLTLVGLCAAIARRLSESKIRRVTTTSDWVVFVLLVIQVVSGIWVALFHPWGSSWFAATATPYLWSLLKLNPEIQSIAAMPLAVKVHIVNAYALIGFFPFTRLVHILVVPNPYLWRKPQVVRWYRRAGA
ncbi:MAG: respiratory nitrate reductase subunit gamma [Acidobacteria bacterium]|nr:respiratory nitrate reductase subunit gamma [Acidobacteriota bacterium]MBI3469975.1 respiratory nitrate reductase subunit gamma [Candidatus Solibacter usitatus]